MRTALQVILASGELDEEAQLVEAVDIVHLGVVGRIRMREVTVEELRPFVSQVFEEANKIAAGEEALQKTEQGAAIPEVVRTEEPFQSVAPMTAEELRPLAAQVREETERIAAGWRMTETGSATLPSRRPLSR